MAYLENGIKQRFISEATD